ncbi:MAG: cupredoxin family protein [Acidovorax sp.]|uniref:cupredoxin domain-containing protein n=1 Tax=Acidovorax sp. TaxID=1872122 RepID=UPI002610D7BF|nr:cupredoxin family protein [Acidovorax sp.]MDH4417471.1 cupredoxin family protein [Acidovorax sp.]
MNAIKFIAVCALLAGGNASFGHENLPHAAHNAPVVKEQKKEQMSWGIAGDTQAVARTITIRMTDDMRFTPRHIQVREGETVRLRAENKGQVLHEIVIGTKAELDAHAEMMVKHPGMEHDEPYMAHVGAGKKGDIVWQFNRAGQFDFACLIAGHYQAGMTGTITVLPRKP